MTVPPTPTVYTGEYITGTEFITSNHSTNLTCGEYYTNINENTMYDASRTQERVLNVTYWSFVTLVGILGNVLVVVAMCRKKSLTRVTSNRYTLLLAIVDLTALSLIGMNGFLTAATAWPFLKHALLLCRVFMWLEQLLKYISMMLLAVIAVDRFRMLWRAMEYKTRKHFKLSVALAVVIPIFYIVSSVIAISFDDTMSCYDKALGMCVIMPATIEQGNTGIPYLQFIHTMDACVHLLCILLLLVLYSAVLHAVWSRKTLGSHAGHRSAEMMIAVCFMFILTHLPNTVTNFVSVFGDNFTSVTGEEFNMKGYYRWLFWVYHLNGTINPLIYTWFNTHLRDEIKHMVLFCKKSPKIAGLEKHH